MQNLEFQGIKFSFESDVSLSRILYRKIKFFLGWLFVLILILIGIYGMVVLIIGYTGDFVSAFHIFSASLLADMFLFYLWHYKRDGILKIDVSVLAKTKEQEQIIEIASFLNKPVQLALDKAWMIAYKGGYHYVRPIHIFSAFLDNREFKKILKRLNCDFKDVASKTHKIFQNAAYNSGDMKLTGPVLAYDIENIFFSAYLFCMQERCEQVGLLELLWAIAQQKNLVQSIFDEFGVSPEDIEMAVRWADLEKQIKKSEKSFIWKKLFKPKKNLDRAMIAAATPFLNKVSQDLTLMAREGEFEMVVGREKEVAEVFNLFASGHVGVALVGPSQVGKKSVLKKIAQLMVAEDVPKFLQDKRLVRLDLGSLVGLSGARERGEEYLKKVIYEVSRAKNIILVLENVDNLVGLRSHEGGLGFAEILASALDSKLFRFIGTASSDGFAEKIEGKILDQVLSRVDVAMPNRDLLWKIVVSKVFVLEKELKVLFSVDAVEEAINLSDRYFYGDTLPMKVLEILKEAAFLVRSNKGKNSFIGGQDIVDLVSDKVDIPLGEVQKAEKEKLLNLENLIHEHLIDQEEAVKAVSDALRRNRLDLQNLKKPMANFLFVGPTGVGKTELAKTLARVYFGDEKRMIRLDMSEYQEKRSLRRLIGQRSEEGVHLGYLTEAIKRQSYTLLLLDEIEKAHPDILNVFLQVMDDGRLTDIAGETVNFNNVIMIATSNAGTQFIQQKIREGVNYQSIDQQLQEQILLDYFRPEFMNRFDKIVLFKSLSMGDLLQITQLILNGIRAKLEVRGVELVIENEAVQELSQLGFNPLYGARASKRVVQDKVENAIARLFLEDKVKRRDKIILRRGLIIEVKSAPEL